MLNAGPFTVKAYTMYLIATPATRRSPADLIVVFERGSDANLQEHYYSFDKGVKVTIAANGAAASVSAALGVFGHVKMSFSSAGMLTLAAGCNGAVVRQHAGALSGRRGFNLVTLSSYFGTVRAGRLPAYITVLHPGTSPCKPALSPATPGATLLNSSSYTATGFVNFEASRSATGVTGEDVIVDDTSYARSDGVNILHAIHALGVPTADFGFASDLSSAQATGAGSFLTGTLSYTQTVPAADTGTVTGNLAADFDGLGFVSLAGTVNTLITGT